MERDKIILLDSSQHGGIESHVYHLARALKQQGWPSEIWFYKRYPQQHPLIPRLEHEQIKYRYLQGSLGGLYKQIKMTQPRLIHTHGYKAGVIGRIVG